MAKSENLPDDALAIAAQLDRANRYVAAHWRTPEEQKDWQPKCPECRNGACPREDWANGIITKSFDLDRRRDG